MVAFFKETSVTVAEANPILESKGTAAITQGDKMFKIFSRPQIDLEDMMKFEKVKEYVAENNLDRRNFRTSRNSSEIFWLYRERKK